VINSSVDVELPSPALDPILADAVAADELGGSRFAGFNRHRDNHAV
jgi:hypothetical protein